MKTNLLQVLCDSIGNGFVKNIVSARGTGAKEFLFENWKKYLIQNYPDSVIIDTTELKNKNIKEICIFAKQSERKTFILINQIWKLKDFDSIINICANAKNIDLFTTSHSFFPIYSSEKITLIRGRLFNIYYPSTLYEDYLGNDDNGNVIDFLFNNKLNSEVIDLNMKLLDKQTKKCLQIVLNYHNKPLTYRQLAEDMSKNSQSKTSRYLAQQYFSTLDEKSILYLIERFDIKRCQRINGKFVYPIDTRFYFETKRDDETICKFMTAAFISRLFYDNWFIQKATYVSQRNNRTFCGDTDAGFLVKKNDKSFLIFISNNISDDVVLKAKLVPSDIQKIIITLDVIGDIQFGNDGIIFYSYEKLLKEGLLIYER